MILTLKSLLFPAVLTGTIRTRNEYVIAVQSKTSERDCRLDKINERLGNVVKSLKDNGQEKAK